MNNYNEFVVLIFDIGQHIASQEEPADASTWHTRLKVSKNNRK